MKPDLLRASHDQLLAALKASLEALTRPMGPELGIKGRDYGLLDQMRQAIRAGESARFCGHR